MHTKAPKPAAYSSRGGWVPRSLLAAVAVLVLALAASCGGASGGGGAQQPTEGGGPAKEDQALGREPLGDADAPVVLTEYADYQ